jgi:hypothetical protein
LAAPEVRLYGTSRLVTGFRSSKAQALLYFLAVTGRPQARPTLGGLLWGDQPEEAARASLSKCLSNLRELLGDARADRSPDRGSFNRSITLTNWIPKRFAAGVSAPRSQPQATIQSRCKPLWRSTGVTSWRASMCATHPILSSGC